MYKYGIMNTVKGETNLYLSIQRRKTMAGEFINTVAGKQFIGHTMPSLVKAIERLADAFAEKTITVLSVDNSKTVLTIHSKKTSSLDIIEIADECKHDMSGIYEGDSKWLKEFIGKLPADCRIAKTEVRR